MPVLMKSIIFAAIFSTFEVISKTVDSTSCHFNNILEQD